LNFLGGALKKISSALGSQIEQAYCKGITYLSVKYRRNTIKFMKYVKNMMKPGKYSN
jgi:hypothetical protein